MNARLAQKEATRRLIVQAARELFTARGYSRVDIRLVCTTIKRSTGAVYAHFDRKAALWREAMGFAAPEPATKARDLADMIAAGLSQGADPSYVLELARDRLRDFATHWSGPL